MDLEEAEEEEDHQCQEVPLHVGVENQDHVLEEGKIIERKNHIQDHHPHPDKKEKHQEIGALRNNRFQIVDLPRIKSLEDQEEVEIENHFQNQNHQSIEMTRMDLKNLVNHVAEEDIHPNLSVKIEGIVELVIQDQLIILEMMTLNNQYHLQRKQI